MYNVVIYDPHPLVMYDCPTITDFTLHAKCKNVLENAEVLRSFFHFSYGPKWFRSWDMTDRYYCGQYGTFCKDGLVERLHLIGNNLQGSLPFEIGESLTRMTVFELSDNQLEGSLPSTFNALSLLNVLRVGMFEQHNMQVNIIYIY